MVVAVYDGVEEDNADSGFANVLARAIDKADEVPSRGTRIIDKARG